jgi:hypothetical protein
VQAAFAKVRKRGLDDLPKLIKEAKDSVRTDLPLDRATDLFKLYKGVDLAKTKRAVFGPKTYAVRAHGYTYHLVFAKCKAWIAKNFPKERPYGTWPETAIPSGLAAPSQGSAAPGPTVASPGT